MTERLKCDVEMQKLELEKIDVNHRKLLEEQN